MILYPAEARACKQERRLTFLEAVADGMPVTSLKAPRASQNRDRAWFTRVRTARRSWHACKAAWVASLLASQDPYADARADLQADRAIDWREAGF